MKQPRAALCSGLFLIGAITYLIILKTQYTQCPYYILVRSRYVCLFVILGHSKRPEEFTAFTSFLFSFDFC